MLPRTTYIARVIKNIEWTISQFLRPPRELAIIHHYDPPKSSSKPFSLNDLIGDGFLMAVPKFRRTVEKRWKRKFGSPDYVWKMLVPKTNIIICSDCGHHHERGRLCEKCYERVEKETNEIKNKIGEKLGTNKPIENDVVVLYDGEHLPDKTQTETKSVGSDNILMETEEIASLISLDEVTIHDYETKYIVRTFPDFDLSTLLQTTAGGNSIIEFYKHFGYLNNTKRNQLTDLIIKHIYTHIVNSKITYEDYNVLAAKIITLFPTETIGTYYTKPIKKQQTVNKRSIIARGKLVDKVRNLLYKYGDRKRKLSDNYCENGAPKLISFGTLKESHNTDFVWLQNNTDPWGDVEKKWKDTYYLRKGTYYDNLHSFISEWRILNDHRSDVLINIDFDLMFPEKGLLFYLNWKDFYKQIINLRPTQDEIILNQIQSVEHLEDDLKIPTQISIFGHLIPPKGRLTKKEKFSTQEAIDSIFVCAKPSEFWQGKRIVEMKKERPHWFSKNLLQKSTQQPSSSTDVKPTDLA